MWRNWIPFWRPGVSSYGGDIDLLFFGLLVTSLAVMALLLTLLLAFSIRYHASSNADRGHRIKKTWHWEVSWRAVTLVGFLALFVWGAALYLHVYGTAPDAMPIYVVAKQWMWKVQHPGGQREINELHVPLQRSVRLIMASQDVIHSFFMPALRVKHDVVPGRYQELWYIAGFSSILTGLNFIVTIHRLRAPGLTWYRLPIFIWSIYATSVILVLATPELAMTLLLLALERIAGIGIFDPRLGGDPLLFQHMLWFYSHPAVYIMILPGMGVVSELVTCFSRKNLFGYKFVAWCSIAIAAIGFFVWGHHMFVSGQSLFAGWYFLS
jgi:Cytochrome C and Quinol oxidase polypeptide I/Cytochrome C oxidase subunit II, periplasmic domain